MKRSIGCLVAVGVALTGCSNTPPGTASTPSPTATAAPSAPGVAADQVSPAPGPAACRTADLEVAIAGQQGAAGHIGLDFEVRNRSATTCRLFGYFGLSLLTSEGKVGIVARRSTRVFTAATGPPVALLLPSGSPALPATPVTGPPPVLAGHAHFAAAYSDVCDNAPNATGNAWQLIPPDQAVPTSLLTEGARAITICGLEVTPAQASPPQP